MEFWEDLSGAVKGVIIVGVEGREAGREPAVLGWRQRQFDGDGHLLFREPNVPGSLEERLQDPAERSEREAEFLPSMLHTNI
jgi:hypothetical protein